MPNSRTTLKGKAIMKSRQMVDGEEVSLATGIALRPGTSIWGKVTCCRCGLTHTHRYRISKRGTLKLTSWRHDGPVYMEWERISKEFEKRKCRTCDGPYPCDEHNIEP